jgi:hypothetical protein
MLSSSCPPLTLLALDGIFLKKAPNSNNWVPIIIGYSTNIPEFGDGALEGEISIWNLLDLHRLLSYYMHESVVHLLQFLCECIWAEYSGRHGKEMSTAKLLDNFRKLDIPHEGGERSEQRHKIKQIAGQLRDIILRIIDQISVKEVKRSSDVIKQAFGNRFKKISQATLESYILKSIAHARQIKQILLSEFGLEIFFGKKAVGKNTELIHRVILSQQDPNLTNRTTPDLNSYVWSDHVFEDEGQSRPMPPKSNGSPPPPLPSFSPCTTICYSTSSQITVPWQKWIWYADMSPQSGPLPSGSPSTPLLLLP